VEAEPLAGAALAGGVRKAARAAVMLVSMSVQAGLAVKFARK